jgi:hypothetical protein
VEGFLANLSGETDGFADIFAKFFQQIFTLRKREPEQAFAVKLEQIENVKAQRRFSPFQLERLQELK